jgi:hypothetical protein
MKVTSAPDITTISLRGSINAGRLLIGSFTVSFSAAVNYKTKFL